MCRSWRSSSGSCAAIWPDAVPIYTERESHTAGGCSAIHAETPSGGFVSTYPARIAIELAAQPTPIRQILRHTALELSPMPVGPQMRHLMDEHVFEILGRQQPQLQIQPDATGPRRAGSPTGRHRTQCDMRRTFADDCGPMLHQCRQPRVDRPTRRAPGAPASTTMRHRDETDRLPAARRTVRGPCPPDVAEPPVCAAAAPVSTTDVHARTVLSARRSSAAVRKPRCRPAAV